MPLNKTKLSCLYKNEASCQCLYFFYAAELTKSKRIEDLESTESFEKVKHHQRPPFFEIFWKVRLFQHFMISKGCVEYYIFFVSEFRQFFIAACWVDSPLKQPDLELSLLLALLGVISTFHMLGHQFGTASHFISKHIYFRNHSFRTLVVFVHSRFLVFLHQECHHWQTWHTRNVQYYYYYYKSN